MNRLAVAALCAFAFLNVTCRLDSARTGNHHKKAEASFEDVARRVTRYYARANPEVKVRVVSLAASKQAGGWKQGTLEWSTGGEPQKMPFLVSRDARYFIPGEVIDLSQDPLEAIMNKIALAGRPFRGPSTATTVVVEYGDFQCPFCLRAYQMVEETLMRRYGDRIRFYFKHLPLAKLHPWAESAARATECAARQNPDAFWTMYDSFFRGQKETTVENVEAKAAEYASAANLDVDKLLTCLRARETAEQVQADVAEAAAVGVSSTPTFIINGQKIVGAQPIESFQSIIEQEVAKAQAEQPPS